MPLPCDLSFYREQAETFRHVPTSGAYWTIKHQYANLFDEVVYLQEQLRNQSIEKAEIPTMKITFSIDEVQKILENHLNEHVVKAPVEVNFLSIYDDKGKEVNISLIEIDVQPKENGK